MPKYSDGKIAIGALIAFSFWIFVFLPFYYGDNSQTDKCSGEENKKYGFWEKTSCDPIAYFTLWLVGFTGVLGAATIGLLYATNRSAKIAERGLTEIERAFVSFRFNTNAMVNAETNTVIAWQIITEWKNSGSTQAMQVFTHSSWNDFGRELSPEFTFPDIFSPGKIENTMAFIAPVSEISGDALTIPCEILEAARVGWIKVYVWGWIEYNDVFEKMQRTEFCNEVVCEGNPYFRPLQGQRLPIRMQIYPKHTGADAGCYRQPRPVNQRGRPLS